jgi:hypothetical protein
VSPVVVLVALGFVLGPHVLGILGRDLITTFEPLTQVALGWLAVVIGLQFGRADDRRAGLGATVLGVVGGSITGVAVAAAVWFFFKRVLHAPRDLALVLTAGGIGAVGAGTASQVTRWAIERRGADGKLTRLLGDVARGDAIVPLVAMGFLFSLAPAAIPLGRVHLLPLAWFGITVGFGALLGAMSAMHIGRELRVDQTWGVLLGTSVLGLGVAARLDMSALTVLFFMGWTLAAISRHRAALRTMVVPIEQPILLPALVLAGAYVDFRGAPGLAAIVGVAVAARVVAKIVLGAALAVPLRASPLLGASLLSSGALSISVGLAFAIRFPGPIGNAVVTTAFVLCVVGELLGPLALKRELTRAGEIPEPGTRSEVPATGGGEREVASP